jgi:hypothetical protein
MSRMSGVRFSIGIAMIVFGLLGCAGRVLRVPPGSSAADVRAAGGTPSEQRALPDGKQAWYYETGPSGWTTYRVVLDANNRVVSSEQVLTEQNFRTQLVVNKTNRREVLDQLGKPGLVSHFPNLAEEVWTYRYLEGTLEMLNDVHFDAATGVVKSYAMYRDPAYANILG